MIAASIYTRTVIVVVLPSGLRFKNISFETRCATCSPQLLRSSFDRPTPCLVNSSLILPNSRLWKDAVVSWEAVCRAFMDGWRVCVQLAKDWCHVSWRMCTPSEMCVRRQTGTADNTKKYTKEMNQKCLLLDVFGPSGKDFLPRLLSSLPFKHTFFSSLFCLYLTSPVPLISCTFPSFLSLSPSLPIYPPWWKAVIPFPLSLQSFTSLS